MKQTKQYREREINRDLPPTPRERLTNWARVGVRTEEINSWNELFDKAISAERKRVIEEVKEWVIENERVYDGAVTVDGIVDLEELVQALTKLEDK